MSLIKQLCSEVTKQGPDLKCGVVMVELSKPPLFPGCILRLQFCKTLFVVKHVRYLGPTTIKSILHDNIQTCVLQKRKEEQDI